MNKKDLLTIVGTSVITSSFITGGILAKDKMNEQKERDASMYVEKQKETVNSILSVNDTMVNERFQSIVDLKQQDARFRIFLQKREIFDNMPDQREASVFNITLDNKKYDLGPLKRDILDAVPELLQEPQHKDILNLTIALYMGDSADGNANLHIALRHLEKNGYRVFHNDNYNGLFGMSPRFKEALQEKHNLAPFFDSQKFQDFVKRKQYSPDEIEILKDAIYMHKFVSVIKMSEELPTDGMVKGQEKMGEMYLMGTEFFINKNPEEIRTQKELFLRNLKTALQMFDKSTHKTI